MNNQKSPFRKLVTPPKGQRSLEQVDIPATLKRGGQTTMGIYIETCGRNAVRLLVTEGYELIWTERIEARDHNVASATALREANDMIADEKFQKEYGFCIQPIPTETPSMASLTVGIAFPIHESELARI